MSDKLKAGARVLVAGAGGMLGTVLVPLLLGRGYEVVASDRTSCGASIAALDITDLSVVKEYVRGVTPAVVINCAAYTAVDKAETDKEQALLINGEGASNLARAAREVGAVFVHVSTDFVFDGAVNIPYTEDDEPTPLCVYGSSKLAGELAVLKLGGDFIIIRTAWLYGQGNANFVTKIAEKAKSAEELSVVFDQLGTPTYTVDLAEAILNLMERRACGLYHFSNEGVASWYDFACAIVTGLRQRGVSFKVARIVPVLSAAYKTAAKRPPYSVMDKTKYKDTTGESVRYWNDALSAYLDKIVKDGELLL
jgi:dTDP-4-dehydrorhamnose reductase